MKSSPFEKGLTNLQTQSIEEGKETCLLWLSLLLRNFSWRCWFRFTLVSGRWRLLNGSRASFTIVGRRCLFSLKRAALSRGRRDLLDWSRASFNISRYFHRGRAFLSIDRCWLFNWLLNWLFDWGSGGLFSKSRGSLFGWHSVSLFIKSRGVLLSRGSLSLFRWSNWSLFSWNSWCLFNRNRSLFSWGLLGRSRGLLGIRGLLDWDRSSFSVGRWCLFSWSSSSLRVSGGCLLSRGRSAFRVGSRSLCISWCRFSLSLWLLFLATFLILMTAQRCLLG